MFIQIVATNRRFTAEDVDAALEQCPGTHKVAIQYASGPFGAIDMAATARVLRPDCDFAIGISESLLCIERQKQYFQADIFGKSGLELANGLVHMLKNKKWQKVYLSIVK